jgi:hypothetical protein
MDFLYDHKEKIEESLYWRLADLFSLDVDIVFYDTTSVHFEIEEEDEKLRKRGYSKNGRSDAPQMVVGLAVTRDGFPVKSWVFPGNTADVTTIEIRPVFHRSPHRIREELRSIKIGQLFGPKGTVYQVTPGTPEARNMLKKLNIDPLPSVLSME